MTTPILIAKTDSNKAPGALVMFATSMRMVEPFTTIVQSLEATKIQD